MKDRGEDIIRIFKYFDIEYWTDGKNVTVGWINIQCPFCDDHSNHMGVDRCKLTFNCWRCRQHGYFTYLVARAAGTTEKHVEGLLGNSAIGFKKDAVQQIEDILAEPVAEEEGEPKKPYFPEYAEIIDERTDSPLLEYYMKRRNISLQTLMQHYCLICECGSHKMRIIIPVLWEGEVVSWQAADMTGQAVLKYRTAPGPKLNQYLYEYYKIQLGSTIYLVEGVLVHWRMEHDVLCHFGTSITPRQRRLIVDKQPEEVLFAWDGEAYEYAVKAANEVAPYLPRVGILRLLDGRDPDNYGRDSVLALKETAEWL